jgi:predicted dehydrogenase
MATRSMPERVLIVGLGSIGRRHARLARQLMADAEIVALTRRDTQDLDVAGVDRCVNSLEEALRFGPGIAVVATPATRHLEVALALAAAGVHLLVEKPISSSSPGVCDLIRVCHERGVALMTGYNLRFSPSLNCLRTLVAERRVGRVLSVRAEIGQFLPSWRPDADYRTTVSAQAQLGGGVLLELSHDVDYLRWIFGEVEWVSAVVLKQSSLDIDVEDVAHVVMSFMRRDDHAPVVATLNMDFIRYDTTRGCTVIGEGGSLRWDALAGTVEVFDPAAQSWELVFKHESGRDETYLAEWRHLIDCVATAKSPLVSGVDGLAALRIIEAARESSTGRAAVFVEHDDCPAMTAGASRDASYVRND